MAKDRGRNRIQVYREDDAELAQRHGEMRWVSRIQQALEEDRLHLAERYNLSVKLDRWVIGTALEWLTHQPERLKRLHLCCINLSGRSLGDDQ